MDVNVLIGGETGKSIEPERSTPVNDPQFRDRRAALITEYAVGTGYPGKFLKIMDPEPTGPCWIWHAAAGRSPCRWRAG